MAHSEYWEAKRRQLGSHWVIDVVCTRTVAGMIIKAERTVSEWEMVQAKHPIDHAMYVITKVMSDVGYWADEDGRIRHPTEARHAALLGADGQPITASQPKKFLMGGRR